MITVSRIWDIDNLECGDAMPYICKRPRIDFRISEYVLDYIDKTVLKPKKIMQNKNYDISLLFGFYYSGDFEDNVYNTENAKYSFQLSDLTMNRVKYKNIWICCYSNDLNGNIKPNEYADIVYDMIGSYLVYTYKGITKESMDKIKSAMDYPLFEKYRYPALFSEQKYQFDENPEVEQAYTRYYKEQ